MTNKTIYYFPPGPPTRFAVVVAKHLAIDVDLKICDFSKGEQFKPEYLAINPAGTVPAYVEDDFKLFDSSAIAIYLVENYAKDDSLYPKDPEKRAKVNEKLFFCSGTVYPTGHNILFPVIFGNATEIKAEDLKKMDRCKATIETFLTGNSYLTGETMTLADLFLWSLFESGSRIDPLDPEKYKNMIAWMERMRQHPANEFQQQGAEMQLAIINKCLERNRKAAGAN